MKEHPIPQDITSYRFHIVGSMTLKQFGEVGAGALIAFIIYSTNLIGIIKWPLVAIFGLGGIAAAFVPIEERPLSHWIITFFSILYKPTQFFWKRMYNIPAPFLFKGNQQDVVQLKELDLTPARRQRIKEFLSSTHAQSVDEFTLGEREKVDTIMSIFQTQQTSFTTATHETVLQKPNLTVRVRSIRQSQFDEQPPEDTEHLTVNSLDDSGGLDNTILLDDDTPHFSSDKRNTYLKPEEVAQTLEVPETDTVKLEQPKDGDEVEALARQQDVSGSQRAFVESTREQTQDIGATDQAQFNTNLPFPTPPTIPNKLVGMVLTPKNELIPGAIVEIKTAEGHVSRAVKTNALGQFFITTPLENGNYVVSVEKENYQFKPLSISLTGTLIDPIEITSRA